MPTLKANIGGTWVPIGYAPPSLFTSTQPGIVPASGGGTVNFLRADGTWGQPTAAIAWPQTAQLSDQHASALTVNPSSHATSERAALTLGSWAVGQDFDANGTKDFYVYSAVNGLAAVRINAAETNITLRADSTYIVNKAGTDLIHLDSGGGIGGIYFTQGQSGWYMTDTEYLRAINAKTIYTAGTVRGDVGFQFYNGGWVFKKTDDPDCGIYYWGADDIGFACQGQERIRASGGTLYMTGPMFCSNEVYGGINCWIRARGTTGFLFHDYGGGWYMDEGSTVRVYNSKNIKTLSGQIISSKWAGSAFWDQAFFADATASMAGMGWHPGGVAGTIRMQQNSDTFHFQNTDASGYYRCAAREWAIASSERYKQDMVPLTDALPAMPSLPVATMVRALRPVWFRTDEYQQMAEVPPKPDDVQDWRPDPETFTVHVCRVEMCGHTPDDPCAWRTNWQRGQLGFIAEEVERVLPQLVRLDAEMQPQLLDLGSLVGLAYAMLQELDTRLTALEAA